MILKREREREEYLSKNIRDHLHVRGSYLLITCRTNKVQGIAPHMPASRDSNHICRQDIELANSSLINRLQDSSVKIYKALVPVVKN